MNETTIDTTIQQSFEVGAQPRLSVRNVAGRVEVRAGEPGTIDLHAVKHGRPEAMENTRVEMEQHGDQLSVVTKQVDTAFAGGRHSLCAVDYTITVPAGCEVDVNAVSAEVRVRDTQAPVSLETVSGGIDVVGVTGDCRVKTVSGSTTIGEIAGTMHGQSVSGALEINRAALQSFDLQTVSGDITVDTPLSTGQRYRAHTVSGDLRLRVPDDTGATIWLKTVSGSLRSSLPAQIQHADRRHWQGIINGGGAEVEMDSVSGDLTIDLAADEHGRPGREGDGR